MRPLAFAEPARFISIKKEAQATTPKLPNEREE